VYKALIVLMALVWIGLPNRTISKEDNPDFFHNFTVQYVKQWKEDHNTTDAYCESLEEPYHNVTDWNKFYCFPKVQST